MKRSEHLSLSLVTWNLGGLDEYELDCRVEAACFETILGAPLSVAAQDPRPRRPRPDIILFQEVTQHILDAHLRPHLRAAGYQLVVPNTDRNYFELIAVLAPYKVEKVRAVPLAATSFGRVLTEVLVRTTRGISFKALTAHFDSGQQQTAIRTQQACAVLEAMAEITEKGANSPALFGGDTNMRVSEWAGLEAFAQRLNIDDAWTTLGSPPQFRWTWRNEHRKARFDRVWATAHFVPQTFERIGDRPIDGFDELLPSDHFGIRVGFILHQEQGEEQDFRSNQDGE